MGMCRVCRYWVERGTQSARHPDDTEGQCHRRAPSPGAYINNQSLNALSHIAWLLSESVDLPDEQKDEIQNDIDRDGSSIDTAYWPTTTASDWCGEFEVLSPEPLEGISKTASVRRLDLPSHIIDRLYRDYPTVDHIRRALDSEIMRLPGIGKIALRMIRESIGD